MVSALPQVRAAPAFVGVHQLHQDKMKLSGIAFGQVTVIPAFGRVIPGVVEFPSLFFSVLFSGHAAVY